MLQIEVILLSNLIISSLQWGLSGHELAMDCYGAAEVGRFDWTEIVPCQEGPP